MKEDDHELVLRAVIETAAGWIVQRDMEIARLTLGHPVTDPDDVFMAILEPRFVEVMNYGRTDS